MKRLIQVYDEQCVRNVGAVMSLDFDEAIFLFNRFTDTQNMNLLKKVLKKHCRTRISFYQVKGKNIDLSEIVDENTYFNLNGPDNLLNVLVTMFAEKNDCRTFYLFTNEQKLVPLNKANDLLKESKKITLSLEDIINVNGSIIVHRNKTKPDIEDKKQIKDILSIFDVIKGDFSHWNSYISKLSHLISSQPDDVYLSVNKKTKAIMNDNISKELMRIGVIRKEGNRIVFKSNRCKRMLKSSGTWLEYFTYIHLMKSGYFDDVDMGVVVDFDGDQDSTVDDRCEIDVLCLKGLKSVFISNKTGKIKQEALYEIVSHARMFGNKNGIPVLCMAKRVKDINPGIYKKAQELGVRVIDYDDIYNDKVAERVIDIVNDKYKYK